MFFFFIKLYNRLFQQAGSFCATKRDEAGHPLTFEAE